MAGEKFLKIFPSFKFNIFNILIHPFKTMASNEGGNGSGVNKPARDSWEEESDRDREVRHGRISALMHLREEKDKIIREQAKAMVVPLLSSR